MRKTAYYIDGFDPALLFEGELFTGSEFYAHEDVAEHIFYMLRMNTEYEEGEEDLLPSDSYEVYERSIRGIYNPKTKELVELDATTEYHHEKLWREGATVPIKRFGVGEYSYARNTYEVTWLDQKPVDPETENSIYLKDLL